MQAEVFHASKMFKETRPKRIELMNDLTKIFINNRLHAFCFKYSKSQLFEATKQLSYLNDNDIINFNSSEFQALFYFLILLNTYLRDVKPTYVIHDIGLYFDRNVYGNQKDDQLNFPDPRFVIKFMTFTEKSKISLLALADFFGYIFRKSKISQDKIKTNKDSLETSNLTISCYSSLLSLSSSGLFHFLDYDKHALGISYNDDLN